LEALTIEALLERRTKSLNGSNHALDALAIASIGDALATTGQGAFGYLRKDDDCFALRSARDGKLPANRPVLHLN
jgi:hypothetical protein